MTQTVPGCIFFLQVIPRQKSTVELSGVCSGNCTSDLFTNNEKISVIAVEANMQVLCSHGYFMGYFCHCNPTFPSPISKYCKIANIKPSEIKVLYSIG